MSSCIRCAPDCRDLHCCITSAIGTLLQPSPDSRATTQRRRSKRVDTMMTSTDWIAVASLIVTSISLIFAAIQVIPSTRCGPLAHSVQSGKLFLSWLLGLRDTHLVYFSQSNSTIAEPSKHSTTVPHPPCEITATSSLTGFPTTSLILRWLLAPGLPLRRPTRATTT